MIYKTPVLIFLCFLNISEKENRYTSAYSYINQSIFVQEQIKETFSLKNEQSISLEVSNEIIYSSLEIFSDKLKHESFLLGKYFYNDLDSCLKVESKFLPYKINGLSKLKNSENPSLFLVFSRPSNNYMVAKIYEKESAINYYTGVGMVLLFLFNEADPFKIDTVLLRSWTT